MGTAVRRRVAPGLTAFLAVAALYGLISGMASPHLPRRVWMGAHYVEDVDLLPTYRTLAEEAWYLIRSGSLSTGTVVTAVRVLVGVAVGTSGALVAALVALLEPPLGALLGPWVGFFQFTSPLALLPLYVLWFGAGEVARVLLVATVVGVTVFVGALEGASLLPARYLEAAAVLGLSRRAILRKVVVPYATPYVLASFRVAVALAWTGVVVAEVIASAEPRVPDHAGGGVPPGTHHAARRGGHWAVGPGE